MSTQPGTSDQQAVPVPGRRASGAAAWGIGLPRSWPRIAGRNEAVWGAAWRAALLPLLLVVAALALSLPRLTTPDVYVFDELYYAYTAGNYVAGEEAYSTAIPPRADPAIEWTHPPLAKLLIAGGILVAGDNPLGWRIASVLFGAAGVVIAYSLALALTGSRTTSALAAGLLLLDGLYLVESRTGMSNLFLLVFANGALLPLTRVLAVPPERVGPPLLATGIFMGLAIATKWSAVALAGLIGLVVVWQIGQLWRGAQSRMTPRPAAPGPLGANDTQSRVQRRQDPEVGCQNIPATGVPEGAAVPGAGAAVPPESPLAGATWPRPSSAARTGLTNYLRWSLAALAVIPIIYLLSYMHFFLTGHGWADFVALHRDMLTYHRELGVVHDDSSPWWQWPLAARGIWYYANERRREVAVVFGNGNPLLYWPMVVAVAWVAIDWWGRRPTALLILAIGFFGQWLPWVLSPRGTFIYHFLPSLPLGCLALAVVMTDGWRQGRLSRALVAAYAVAVVATFVFFYPTCTAMPLSPHDLELRMWLPSWR